MKVGRCWQLETWRAACAWGSHSTNRQPWGGSDRHMHVYTYLLHVPIFYVSISSLYLAQKKSHSSCLRQLMYSCRYTQFAWCTYVFFLQQGVLLNWFLLIYYLHALWMDCLCDCILVRNGWLLVILSTLQGKSVVSFQGAKVWDVLEWMRQVASGWGRPMYAHSFWSARWSKGCPSREGVSACV